MLFFFKFLGFISQFHEKCKNIGIPADPNKLMNDAAARKFEYWLYRRNCRIYGRFYLIVFKDHPQMVFRV